MISKISHIAVYVTDLEQTKNFYTKFFQGTSNNIYKNTEGFSSYFLQFDDEVSLELMHHKCLEKRPVIDRSTGYSHFAFSVGSEEAVLSLTQKISEAGFEIYSQPRKTGDGFFESCVADPDGNRVEITI